jgi:hypothetical protein
VETVGTLEALELSAQAAELVLLKVEELMLLVRADKPRRLIELAHAELASAVERANDIWESHGEGFAEAVSCSSSSELQRAWQEFRSLLARAAGSAQEASAAIAAHLAVTEDALSALGLSREYGPGGHLRLVSPGQQQSPVMA